MYYRSVGDGCCCILCNIHFVFIHYGSTALSCVKWRHGHHFEIMSANQISDSIISAKFHPDPIWNDGALGFFMKSRHGRHLASMTHPKSNSVNLLHEQSCQIWMWQTDSEQMHLESPTKNGPTLHSRNKNNVTWHCIMTSHQSQVYTVFCLHMSLEWDCSIHRVVHLKDAHWLGHDWSTHLIDQLILLIATTC